MAKYELVFLVDPRLSDEDVEALSNGYKELIESYDAQVLRTESWGKRRLAYVIDNFKEAKYLLFEIDAGDRNPFPEVEQRMGQNDKVLRYLTVRTDAGRLRHRASKKKQEEAAAETTAEVG